MKHLFYILTACILLLTSCEEDNTSVGNGSTLPRMNVQDSLAIVAFYHSMKCGEWKEPYHWDLKDYTTWGGITATLDAEANEYRVTEIEVPDAKTYLPDGYSLPSELGNLTRLRSLIVWGDERATGTIPAELYDCPLDTLYVLGKGFSFELPEQVRRESFNRSDYVVDDEHLSTLNPDLLDNWEQVEDIKLPRSGGTRVTAPWEDGFSGEISGTFGRDIRKEDGWEMLFHTFKSDEQMELTDNLCFYHADLQIVKVFYCYEIRYIEEGRGKLGPKWFILYGNGEEFQLADTPENERILAFPNLFEYAISLATSGWHGFLFHIPQMKKQENMKEADYKIRCLNN